MRAEVHPDTLLQLWESAIGQPPAARDSALLRIGSEDVAPVGTLGARNARLMELHTRLFGPEMALLSHCPACAGAAQFSCDCEALIAQMPVVDAAPSHRLELHEYLIEFRLPDGTDVAATSHSESEDELVQHLLDRCVLACTREGENMPVRELPVPVLDALSRRMETLDPGASVSFALACPQCGTGWDAPLDVGELVWQKLRAAAERLLLDIDTLARVYGWTEPEVLRLSPVRRAAYLQMAVA